MIRLTFYGAAQTVTGSKYLLEADRARILVDCGLFQGLKSLRLLNWQSLATPPATIQAVVVTHAHIDHIGYLPRLVRDGFHGPIYCTPATADLMAIMLFDAAKNQEEDADYANRNQATKHKPALPLYDARDVTRTLQLVKTVNGADWFSPSEPIWMRYLRRAFAGGRAHRMRNSPQTTTDAIGFFGRCGTLRCAAVLRPHSAAGVRLSRLRKYLRRPRTSRCAGAR